MMNYNKSKFTREIAERLYSIVTKTQSDDDLSLYFTNNILDINGNESRVYIRIFKDELQIAYLVFKNRRKGTGTDLLNECKLICKELGLSRIIIESVLTFEMECFCEKHGFKNIKDEFGKNYVLKIE